MKKLGITLLAVAFSLPMFAAVQGSQAQAPATTQTQTKTKNKTVKRHRMHHSAKKNVKKNTTATPAAK